MATQVHAHKRGSPFGFSGVFAITDADGNVSNNLTGWNIDSQVRDRFNNFVEQINVEVLDATEGLLRLTSTTNTSDWCASGISSTDQLFWDVRFRNAAGEGDHTQTVIIELSDGITQDGQ